jgi:hypothetical protein
MRKMFLLAAVVAAGAAWSAAPASTTIHPLVCSEGSAAPAGTPAQTQDPPGITNEGTHGNTDPDPDHAVEAQPIVAIETNTTLNDLNAFKAPGC